MENQLNKALIDVRKAHRLIYSYQSKIIDLTHFIKSKLNFPEFGGNKFFSHPIHKKSSSYNELKIHKGMWAWDFIYSYVFEYYLGIIQNKNNQISMSVVQVSDTGFYDNDNESYTDIESFENEDKAISKLIFIIEKKEKNNDFAWNKEWFEREVINNKERMSSKHYRECLNTKNNVQIIYSFPLEKFSDENSTIEALNEFMDYCNTNKISELKIV